MNLGIREGDIIEITSNTDAVDTTTGQASNDLKEGVVGTVVDRELLLKVQVGSKYYLVSAEHAKVKIIDTLNKIKES